MEIVVDKSFLRGVPAHQLAAILDLHQAYMPDVLLYEIFKDKTASSISDVRQGSMVVFGLSVALKGSASSVHTGYREQIDASLYPVQLGGKTSVPQRIAAVGVPICPTCGDFMVRRVAKRGARGGGEFWGCPRYPPCRGTRSL